MADNGQSTTRSFQPRNYGGHGWLNRVISQMRVSYPDSLYSALPMTRFQPAVADSCVVKRRVVDWRRPPLKLFSRRCKYYKNLLFPLV